VRLHVLGDVSVKQGRFTVRLVLFSLKLLLIAPPLFSDDEGNRGIDFAKDLNKILQIRKNGNQCDATLQK
jgi:hypothetical protein